MKKWLLVPAIVLLSACNLGVRNYDELHSPSELNSMVKRADGNVVRVRGFLVHEKDSYGIWNDEEAFNTGAVTRCVTPLYGDALKHAVDSSNRTTVVALGTFIADITKGDIFFYGNCSSTGIRLSEIVVSER